MLRDTTTRSRASRSCCSLPIGYTIDRGRRSTSPNDPSAPTGAPIVIGADQGQPRPPRERRPPLRCCCSFAGSRSRRSERRARADEPGAARAACSASRAPTSTILDLDLDAVERPRPDRDGVWDGQDDYSPGPVTDDNILCGTGVRGDPFQDGAQYEPYRLDEAQGSAEVQGEVPERPAAALAGVLPLGRRHPRRHHADASRCARRAATATSAGATSSGRAAARSRSTTRSATCSGSASTSPRTSRRPAGAWSSRGWRAS